MTTTTSKTASRTLLVFSLAAALGSLDGCDDSPTTAVVKNDFPAAGDASSGHAATVYKLWWVTTLFSSPVAMGTTSEAERTIPGKDFAYALLAPGWSPDDGGRPPRLVPVMSVTKLSVAVHDVLRILVSDDTFTGDCARDKPLAAEDASLIVERIFPGDFVGTTYDPATCTASGPVGAVEGDASSNDASDHDGSGSSDSR